MMWNPSVKAIWLRAASNWAAASGSAPTTEFKECITTSPGGLVPGPARPAAVRPGRATSSVGYGPGQTDHLDHAAPRPGQTVGLRDTMQRRILAGQSDQHVRTRSHR